MEINETALNEAAWKFVDEFQDLANENNISLKDKNNREGWWFNNVKRIIRPTIEVYLKSLNQQSPVI